MKKLGLSHFVNLQKKIQIMVYNQHKFWKTTIQLTSINQKIINDNCQLFEFLLKITFNVATKMIKNCKTFCIYLCNEYMI